MMSVIDQKSSIQNFQRLIFTPKQLLLTKGLHLLLLV